MGAMDNTYASSGTGPEFDLAGRAKTANTLGLIAVIMAMLGACSGYVTFFFAFPLGLIAVHYGRTVMAEAPDEVSAVYARNAMSMGIVAAIYSAMWLLFIFLIVLFYGGLIAAVMAGNL